MAVVAILIALMIFGAQNVPIPRQGADTRSSEPESEWPDQATIPGITADSIILPLRKQGFTVQKDNSTPGMIIWTVSKEEPLKDEMRVVINGDSVNEITLIRAYYFNNSRGPIDRRRCSQFLSDVALVEYSNHKSSVAERWVKRHVGREKRVIYNGVTFELHASAPRIRALSIMPSIEDE